MRTEDARLAAPWPGAIVRSYEDLSGGFREFRGSGTIVLVCGQGLLSAQVAGRMQEAGLEAYSLTGGDRALRRHLAAAESDAGVVEGVGR
jgi:rhodanese-related sulfurtransferase